jgi:hypothetical protein
VGFTAMLTSLIMADPRHLVALAAQLPLAVRRMVAQSVNRLRGRKASASSADPPDVPLYPRALVLNELRGLPWGPLAYLRSRRAAQAWTRDPAPTPTQASDDRGELPAASAGAR